MILQAFVQSYQAIFRAADGAEISGQGSVDMAGRFALLSSVTSLVGALFLAWPLALLLCSTLIFVIMLITEIAGAARSIAKEDGLRNPLRRAVAYLYIGFLALFYLGINTVLMLGLLAPRQSLQMFPTFLWCIFGGAIMMDLSVRLWRLARLSLTNTQSPS